MTLPYLCSRIKEFILRMGVSNVNVGGCNLAVEIGVCKFVLNSFVKEHLTRRTVMC